MSEELLPCPFCGEQVHIEVGNVKSIDVECLICRNCGACSPDTEPYNWNTRINKPKEVLKNDK